MANKTKKTKTDKTKVKVGKLKLNKETVEELGNSDLQDVKGGAGTIPDCVAGAKPRTASEALCLSEACA